MHTVELYEQAMQVAREAGYRVRQEWMDGVGGGPCEIAGQKWLFIDLALTKNEQLQQVVTALRQESPVMLSRLPVRLLDQVYARKAA